MKVKTLDSTVNYRRKEGRLEWHFHTGCRKYPFANYVEAEPGQKVESTMVCPICVRIYREENGLNDNREPIRPPKGVLQFIRSEILGLS